MSVRQSELSDSHYGYDFVVATTVASVNAMLKEFLSNPRPVIHRCWVASDTGEMRIDYCHLLDKAGVDPFTIPASISPMTNDRIMELFNRKFRYGCVARIGLPTGVRPDQMPDIVQTRDDAGSVDYTMLCAELSVVELVLDANGNPVEWRRKEQPTGVPWLVSTMADLRVAAVGCGDYDSLPQDVRHRIGKLPEGTFDVQRLLFVPTKPSTGAPLKIDIGDTPEHWVPDLLRRVFADGLLQASERSEQPAVGYSITRTRTFDATLHPTALEVVVSPYRGPDGQPAPDDQGLSTLCYLCATDGNRLPEAVTFAWNWLDEAEQSDADGVIAVNRAGLANHLHRRLLDYVRQNCLAVHTRADWGLAQITFSWGAEPGQEPRVEAPRRGPLVLRYAWQDEAQDQAWGEGSIALATEFGLDVIFTGNTIEIHQYLVVNMRARLSVGQPAEGDIVRRSIRDTYTLAVGQDGRLTTLLKSEPADDSVDIKTDFVWDIIGDLDKLVKNVEQWGSRIASANFHELDLDLVQDYVFPGGKTFAFKNLMFSDHQDLIAHLTYVAPEVRGG